MPHNHVIFAHVHCCISEMQYFMMLAVDQKHNSLLEWPNIGIMELVLTETKDIVNMCGAACE